MKKPRTKINLERLHRRLWKYVEKTGNKNSFPEWKELEELLGFSHRFFYSCPACLAIGRSERMDRQGCKNCPITSGSSGFSRREYCANCCNGLWTTFVTGNPFRRNWAATEIKNLPWRGRKVFTIEELKERYL